MQGIDQQSDFSKVFFTSKAEMDANPTGSDVALFQDIFYGQNLAADQVAQLQPALNKVENETMSAAIRTSMSDFASYYQHTIQGVEHRIGGLKGHSLSMQDLMSFQAETSLMLVNIEMLSKVADKSTGAVKTLMRNQ